MNRGTLIAAMAMGPLRCILLLFATKLAGAEVWQLAGNIGLGAGYSGDSQQITPQRCYNTTLSSTSHQQGRVQLESALSFSELENMLGISVSLRGQFLVFSAEAKASYMRSIQEKDYSISLNYYQYATNNVGVQLAGYGDEALTESGRSFYKGGNNPHFGLICGDYYIGSYQQGALLAMGLNIRFGSSDIKGEFVKKAGSSFGDIVSAAQSIKGIVTQYNITGSITIQAFQMGGEPSQLANVLTNGSSGQYYALGCSLTSIDKCIKAASGLLDYARNQFPAQFSTTNNTGLAPLGVAYSQFIPINYIGLDAPASLVTPEVVQYRDELFNKLTENEYYQQKFYPFFNRAYPVDLDAAFLNNANLILSKAKGNVGVLMQPFGGAAHCFNFPDKCRSVKARIDSQFRNVTTDDLRFLDAVKYTITTRGGMFYSTGGVSDVASWRAVPDNTAGKEKLDKAMNVHVTEDTYSYHTVVRVPDSNALYHFSYNGKWTGDTTNGTKKYVGTMLSKRDGSNNWVNISTAYQESTLRSPFFFDAYKVLLN